MVWDFGNPQKIEQTKNIHCYEKKKKIKCIPPPQPPPHNRFSHCKNNIYGTLKINKYLNQNNTFSSCGHLDSYFSFRMIYS